MKVTRQDAFTPITVTLETEKEAEVMWILLNFYPAVQKHMGVPEYFHTIKDTKDFDVEAHQMWETLNNVFNREWHREGTI
jgi:hypothetical protein